MEYSQLAWYGSVVAVITGTSSLSSHHPYPWQQSKLCPQLKPGRWGWKLDLGGRFVCMKGPQSQFCLNICTFTKKKTEYHCQNTYEGLPGRSPQEQPTKRTATNMSSRSRAAASAKHPGNKQHTTFQLYQQLTIIIMGDDIPNAVCNDNRFVPGTKNNRLRKTQQEKKKKIGRKREEDGTDGQMNRG